jgi:hypothetical protein
MTPLEVRKLVGGYATGSLSDEERQLLLEAALEDQDLFDELMGEHALKELLDEPGARARLIAALAPAAAPRKPFWIRIWPWVAAAGATAAGVVLSFGLFRPAPPKLVARAFHPPAVVLDSVEPVPSPLPAPAELRITPPAEPKLDSKSVLPAPQPPAATPEPQPQAQSGAVASAAAPLAPPAPAQAPTPRAAEFAAGFVAGASQGALARPDFNYTLSDDGKLRITPLVNGFLAVIANADRIVGSNRAVQAFVAVEFTIPQDATLVTVFLTPQPTPPLAPPADVRMTRIPVKPREEK